jgi:hypothetical protein
MRLPAFGSGCGGSRSQAIFWAGTLTFFYFRFVDESVGSPPIGPWEIAYSIVAFAALTALGYTMLRRWIAPIAACQAPACRSSLV